MTSRVTPSQTHTTTRIAGPLRGFALIASLIILTILALLGAASMTASHTEIQISASVEDAARSFHAAEAGVSAARVALSQDSGQLDFVGNSMQLDLTSAAPDPLSHLHNDLPTVTAVVSGDLTRLCERIREATSRDKVGCRAFDLVSTHNAGNADAPRGHVCTTLRLGISREIIANN